MENLKKKFKILIDCLVFESNNQRAGIIIFRIVQDLKLKRGRGWRGRWGIKEVRWWGWSVVVVGMKRNVKRQGQRIIFVLFYLLAAGAFYTIAFATLLMPPD